MFLAAALAVAVLGGGAEAQKARDKFFNSVVPPGRLYPVGWEELQQDYRRSEPKDGEKTRA